MSYTNAKEEILYVLSRFGKNIKAADINVLYRLAHSINPEKYGKKEYNYSDYDEVAWASLPVDYTSKEYEDFINAMNFEYDSGYGTQFLFGTIWFTDGSWAERYEYDGSECWSVQSLPEIPEYLQKSVDLTQNN